jgi:HprK-related kinase A
VSSAKSASSHPCPDLAVTNALISGDAPRFGLGRYIKVGPFVFFVRTDISSLSDCIDLLYDGFPAWPAASDQFADFHIGVHRKSGLRRHLRPQAVFDLDGFTPFLPLGAHQALLMFEGGLNWTIIERTSFLLVLHAGVVERGGRAIVFPAPPGSGKSTLCAALVHRGWRLLSDELALLSLDDGTLSALARPISLKNESIDIIHRLSPQSRMTTPLSDTGKGNVAFLKPPRDSVARVSEPAFPALIIVPKYVRQAAGALLESKSKHETFKELTDSAYNFSLFGRRGFETLADLVDRCGCYDLRFNDLDQAVLACEAVFGEIQP